MLLSSTDDSDNVLMEDEDSVRVDRSSAFPLAKLPMDEVNFLPNKSENEFLRSADAVVIFVMTFDRTEVANVDAAAAVGKFVFAATLGGNFAGTADSISSASSTNSPAHAAKKEDVASFLSESPFSIFLRLVSISSNDVRMRHSIS